MKKVINILRIIILICLSALALASVLVLKNFYLAIAFIVCIFIWIYKKL